MNRDTIETRVKLCAIRIKNLRKQAGLNQEKFGKQFKVAGPSIARYEIGRRIVPLDLAMRIAEKYGVTLEWITGETKEDNDDLITLISTLSNEQKKEAVRYINYLIERG